MSVAAHHQEPLTTAGPSTGTSCELPKLVAGQVFLYGELALHTPIMASFKLAFTSFPCSSPNGKERQEAKEGLYLQAPGYVGTRNLETHELQARAVAAQYREGGTGI